MYVSVPQSQSLPYVLNLSWWGGPPTSPLSLPQSGVNDYPPVHHEPTGSARSTGKRCDALSLPLSLARASVSDHAAD